MNYCMVSNRDEQKWIITKNQCELNAEKWISVSCQIKRKHYYIQRNLFRFFLTQTKFGLSLYFSDWFGIKWNSVWSHINWKSIITIQTWFILTRFGEYIFFLRTEKKKKILYFLTTRNSSRFQNRKKNHDEGDYKGMQMSTKIFGS